MISWGSSQICSFFEPFVIQRLVTALFGFLYQRHEFQIFFKVLRPRVVVRECLEKAMCQATLCNVESFSIVQGSPKTDL